MRRMILAGLLAAAPAAAAPDVDRLLAGTVTGKPEQCLQPRDTRGQTVVNSSTIIFDRGGGRYYRSDIASCPALSADRALITRQYTGQICAGDIFQIVDLASRVTYGGCTFGPFVPYQRPPAK